MSYSRRQLYAMGETFGDSATRKEVGGRIVYGGGGGSAAPAPQATTRVTESGPTVTNRTTANEIPNYLTDASQDLIARGQALTSRPYEAYTGARVAEFSPDMQTAFGRMRNQGVAGQTTEASGLASLAGRRATDYGEFQTGVQQYMNPYMQGVVDIERRKAKEAADQQSAALSGQAVRQGAFGGSGAALQQRALRRDTAQQLGDIQAQGLNRAYEGAVNQYNAGITGGLSAASQLSGLGQQQFGQEMDITKGLGTAGDVQRQREQALLDVGYGDYLTAQKYPYEQLAFQQGLVSGVPYSTTQRTSEISQPGKTVSQLVEPPKEQPNPASQLIGAGTALYGATGSDKAKGGVVKRYAAGGIAGLNQPEMASALQGMSDPQVQGTAAVPGLPGLTAQTEQIRRDQLRMAAEGQQAPASMTKITSVLSQMSDAELQQYAKLNKSDPYTMALVVAEADRRKEGGMPAQGQPKVVDQKIASMALPEDLGIARLDAGNMEFAGGGIIAFANEGEVPAPEEAISPFGELIRPFRNVLGVNPVLAELRDKRAAAEQGFFEALTPAQKKAREAEIVELDKQIDAIGVFDRDFTKAPAAQAAAPAAGIDNLIMNDEARKRAAAQATAAQAAAAQAAAQGAGPAPTGGAGGAGNSGSGLGGYQKIIDLYDQGFEAQKQAEEEAAGIEETAMTKDRTAQEAAIEEAKKYGSDREERLKKREEGMEGEKERNVNTSFIEAGLAIMAGESPNALLNIAKGARLGLQGYEERLSKINTSKEKLDEDFSRLYELRQEKVGAAGEKLRQIDREIAGLRASAKRNFGNLASSLGDKKIAISKQVLDNAEAFKRSTIAAGISSDTPKRQIFEQLKKKYGGDAVKAQLEMNKIFPDAKENTLGEGYIKSLQTELAKAISDPAASTKVGQSKIAALRAEIKASSGGGGSSASPLPPNPSAANLKIGTVYETARGPAKWTGTGFAPI